MTIDVMSNSPFVSQVNNEIIWKENLVVNQTSLRAFFPRTPSIMILFVYLFCDSTCFSFTDQLLSYFSNTA